MLEWVKVKNKDGTTNQYYINSKDGRYRISRSTVNGKESYTAWRGAVALCTGTTVEAKAAAYDDSLKPHVRTTGEVVVSAMEEIKQKLK